MSTGSINLKRLESLLRRPLTEVPLAEKEAHLGELLEAYERAPDRKEAAQIRRTFLHSVQAEPQLLEDSRFVNFLIEELQSEDFVDLQWEGPNQVVSFCENFYSSSFADDLMARRVRTHTNQLLRSALTQFERHGEVEKMFQLLQIAPQTAMGSDGELLRLRNRAYLYEMRRVHRSRRFLYGYLIIQVILIIVVFPFLFIYAENGKIRDQIEQAAEIELPEEPRRDFFTYSDGLYWSLITAGSIGYGDVTPLTSIGRVIAAVLGVMGVITVGVIAGLILNWITPRQLD